MKVLHTQIGTDDTVIWTCPDCGATNVPARSNDGFALFTHAQGVPFTRRTQALASRNAGFRRCSAGDIWDSVLRNAGLAVSGPNRRLATDLEIAAGVDG